jgi:hypothetical protein
MEQNIPIINDADIKRIIERDFSRSQLAEIRKTLSQYKSENETGRNRVYAGILKLAKSDIVLLGLYTKKANNDFRDVISLAEYPNYSKHAFDDLSENEIAKLISDDWKQYQSWLNMK